MSIEKLGIVLIDGVYSLPMKALILIPLTGVVSPRSCLLKFEAIFFTSGAKLMATYNMSFSNRFYVRLVAVMDV